MPVCCVSKWTRRSSETVDGFYLATFDQSFSSQAVTAGDEKDCTPIIVASYVGQDSCVEQLLLSNTIDCSTLFEGKNAYDSAQPNVRSVGLDSLEDDINEEGRVRVVQLLTLKQVDM